MLVNKVQYYFLRQKQILNSDFNSAAINLNNTYLTHIVHNFWYLLDLQESDQSRAFSNLMQSIKNLMNVFNCAATFGAFLRLSK